MKTFGELPSSYEVSMSYEEQVELLTRKINEIIDELEKYIPTDLAKVATTGEYNDLLNKPDLSNYITKDVDDLTYYTKSSSLSAVATSGNYDDLTNKPTIPTVPTNISSFTNDAGYITKDVDDLTYYTKSSSLSTVATSGDYNDLINKPEVLTVNLFGNVGGSSVGTFDLYSHIVATKINYNTWKFEIEGQMDISNATHQYNWGIIPSKISDLLNNAIGKQVRFSETIRLLGTWEAYSSSTKLPTLDKYGYGTVFEYNVDNYLLPARYYQTSGSIGGWALDNFENGSFMRATIYLREI